LTRSTRSNRPNRSSCEGNASISWCRCLFRRKRVRQSHGCRTSPLISDGRRIVRGKRSVLGRKRGRQPRIRRSGQDSNICKPDGVRRIQGPTSPATDGNPGDLFIEQKPGRPSPATDGNPGNLILDEKPGRPRRNYKHHQH